MINKQDGMVSLRKEIDCVKKTIDRLEFFINEENIPILVKNRNMALEDCKYVSKYLHELQKEIESIIG